MGIALTILGILLAADAAAVAVMLDLELGVTFAAGLFLILWGVNYKKFKNGGRFMKFLNAVFRLVLLYVIGMSCFLAAFGAVSDSADYAESYVVIPGTAVRKSRPGPALKARLDAAADYCSENTDAAVIVSGGRGPGENTAEANVMYSYLIDKGVDGNRITREDQSRSTYENFKFSDAVTNRAMRGADVVIITNGFHVFRARLYAKLCGIDAHTIAAPTRPYLVPVSYVREAFAVIKMLIYYMPKNIIA